MSGITSKANHANTFNFLHHFKNNQYRVVSGGKVAHGRVSGVKLDANFPNPKLKQTPFTNDKVNLWGDGGPQLLSDQETGDYKVAKWAVEQWNQVTDKPLLMTVGFYRPHRPLNAPKAYFEKFPLESIQLPLRPEKDDLLDVPDYGKGIARFHAHKDTFKPRSDHQQILHLGGEQEWKYMVQSYLACVNYVDTQIGIFLETLKHNPRGRETVIVLTSDHGWHLGEKSHWSKAALWRNTTRVPFIVIQPGVTKPGVVNHQPISHVDIFPSLCDFAGISKPKHLEGESILPLLQDPHAKREAAFLSYGPENTVVQTEDYRYIRYEDASEELYHHRKDPHEWNNLSSQPELAKLKEKLKAKVLGFQYK